VPRLSHPNRKANKRGDCAQKEIAVPLVPGLLDLVASVAYAVTMPFAPLTTAYVISTSAPAGSSAGGHEPGELPAEIHLST
jgi:hypothetical protein